MEKKINLRQFSLIAFVSTLSLKLTVVPSLIYQEVKWDSFFIILLLTMIDFISFVFIFYILKRNQDITFYDFLSKIFGKIIAKIIMFTIFLFFLFKILNLVDGGYSYSREVIFQESSLLLFAFVLLVASGALYLFKLKSFGRTVEFFYPFILTLFLIFIIVSIFTAKTFDIRPFFTTTASKFFNTAFNFSLIGGDFLILLLFMGKIKFKNDKSDYKAFFYVILSIFILIFFYYVYNSIFKYTAFLHPNAISELVQFLPLPTILGNFEWLAITLMMLLFLLDGGIFTFGMCDSLLEVARIKDKNMDPYQKWILVFCYFLIVVFLFYIFKSFDELKKFSILYGKYLSIYIILIPIFLFIIQLFINLKNRPKEVKK